MRTSAVDTCFHPVERYRAATQAYNLLPFRFHRLDDSGVLLTNDLGRYVRLESKYFSAFVSHQLAPESGCYSDLRANHFLADTSSSVLTRQMASALLTKKSFLNGFTKLHMFVVTLRCDHSCPYCQVSRQSADQFRYDMSETFAQRAIDLALRTPSPSITIEFQGGEPLLAFERVRDIVLEVEHRATSISKSVDFVVCTNLSTLSDDHLKFAADHKIRISTSLDGPKDLHNRNRPFGRKSSYETVVQGIARVREALGRENLSALMTTTRYSLPLWKEIVDEYARLDLGNIFVRSLSPYGFAVKTREAIGYSMDEFISFYERILDYVIELNLRGIPLVEAYAATLLRKILTPYPVGYVDLRSPAGAGFGAIVYNYDGSVYASDESRMLAEMDDQTFRLGHVEDSYEDIFFGERMRALASSGCNEALAGCADCAFAPFCGADPVFHHATQGDAYGNRATSDFCRKHTRLFERLFADVLAGDSDRMRVYWAWLNEAHPEELRLEQQSCRYV